jgi:hypothetical protein
MGGISVSVSQKKQFAHVSRKSQAIRSGGLWDAGFGFKHGSLARFMSRTNRFLQASEAV